MLRNNGSTIRFNSNISKMSYNSKRTTFNSSNSKILSSINSSNKMPLHSNNGEIQRHLNQRRLLVRAVEPEPQSSLKKAKTAIIAAFL